MLNKDWEIHQISCSRKNAILWRYYTVLPSMSMSIIILFLKLEY